MKIRLQQVEQFPALTGLRGVLCLWVWLLHLGMLLWHSGGRSIADIFGRLPAALILHGYLAVDCFFLLSGFVLSYRYRKEQALISRAFLGAFWRARIARIYPIYLLVLVMLGIGVFVFDLRPPLHAYPPSINGEPPADPMSAVSFIKCLLLIQSWDWFPQLSWNMAAWSVSSEWAMYLLFPVIALAVRRVQSLHTAMAAILVLQFLFIIFISSSHTATAYIEALSQELLRGSTALTLSPIAVELGLLRAGVGFVSGCLLYQIYRQPSFQGGGLHRLTPFLILIIAGILIFGNPTYALIWMPLLLLSLCDGSGFVGRTLARVLPLFIGHISYSLYILHVPLLGALMLWDGLPDFISASHWALLLLLCVVLTIFLICLSALSYWYIERPARRWIKGTGT